MRFRKSVCGITSVAIAVVVTGLPPALPTVASADPAPNSVLTWNVNADQAIWTNGQQPPWAQPFSFAMVQGAVYDAVNAIAGTPDRPYLVAPAANGTESTDAAVATAAYDVLVALFPAQQSSLQTEYNDSLDAIPDGAAKQGGIRVGGAAAAAMLAARQNDGRFGTEEWTVSTAVGKWRPVPPLDVPFPSGAGHWVGDVTPFFVQGAQDFTTSGPDKLTSGSYTRDYKEVKAYGSATSTVRTADETDAAIFWHDRHLPWWGILRDIATTQHLGTLQTARMLALTDLSTADALIACFNDKARWSSWRPYTAIREGANDGNPNTVPDPNWTPLLVTAPFPEYPSGHACATGTITSTLAYFFGTNNIAFTGTSADTPNPRHFTSFSQALTELINARVWGGVHFRTADVNGAAIGFYTTAYAIGHHILAPNQ